MRELSSELEFDQLLSQCATTSSFLVVDFFAQWCPPCRRIAPYFEELANMFSPQDVVFVKVDCDKCRDLATREQITSLPTFKLYHQKTCLNSVSGGPISRVAKMIEDYWLYESTKDIFSCERVPSFFYALAHLIGIAKSAKIAALSHKKYELLLTDEVFENYFLTMPGFMQFLFDFGFEEQGTSLVLTDKPDMLKMNRLISQISGPPLKKIHLDHPLLARLARYKKQMCHHFDPLSQKAAREVVPEAELLTEAAQSAGCSPEAVTPVDYLTQLLRWFKEDFFSWVNELECSTCSAKMSMSAGVPTPEERRSGDAERVEVYTCTQDSTHAQRRFPRYNDPCKLLETRQGRCGEWANCFALILASLRKPSSQADGDSKEEVPWFPGVRFVVDFTDHVWCEVWLEEPTTVAEGTVTPTGRWVHVDVCESLIDAPLVYEAGWHKKLSYIFALTLPPYTAPSEIAIDTQDVTWRYTTDPAAVRSRRKEIGEKLLAVYIAQQHTFAGTAWAEASLSDDPFTLSCVLKELTELMQPSKLDPVAHPEVLRGRQSGSVEWRRARGETNPSGGAVASPGVAPASLWEGSCLPIRPTQFELETGCIYLRYNCALDAYARPFAQPATEADLSKDPSVTDVAPRRSSSGPPAYANINSRGWQSLATRWKNVARKHEKDWKMVYLARKENYPQPGEEGVVEWSVDLRDTGYSIAEVTLFGTLIEINDSNKAALQVCAEDMEGGGSACRRLTRETAPLVSSTDFVGAKRITLSAHLWTDAASEDAKGSEESHLAWQKSQLFRQKDSDSQSWPLEWKLTLKKDEDAKSA
ncbi:Peptide-N(4)-(N-acetyl-beta-glucosaminyl) asparagine amidase [Sparganum proliferum]